MCEAGAVLKRTYGLSPAKRSQIKKHGLAKAAPKRKESGPMNKWEGF
jgi:hypothetical protein